MRSPRSRRPAAWWKSGRGWRLVGIIVAVAVAAAVLTTLSMLIWPAPG